MNLGTYRSKNNTEERLVLIFEITDTLIQQTQTKAQKTLEFTFRKSGDAFSFEIPSQSEGCDWIKGWTILELSESVSIQQSKKLN